MQTAPLPAAPQSNLIGTIGMALGAIALCVGVLHFFMGPIASPKPENSIENLVADTAVSIKERITAKLNKEEPPSPPPVEDSGLDPDRIVMATSAGLGVFALILGFIAYVRREDNRISKSAILLGASAVGLQFLIIALALVLFMFLIFAALQNFGDLV